MPQELKISNLKLQRKKVQFKCLKNLLFKSCCFVNVFINKVDYKYSNNFFIKVK